MNAAVLQLPNVDRRKYIGGSDAGAILGLSPWRTPYEVWLDKTQPPQPEDPKKAKLFKRGKRMEPVVLEMMTDEVEGLAIRERNKRYIDPEFDFMACEIDAESANDENIEVKTVHPMKAKEWGEEDSDEIPAHYTAQVLHGLMVTGRKVCTLGVLIGADDLRKFRVERDDGVIESLRRCEVEFWRNVMTQTPPPAIRLSDLSRMYGVDAGSVIDCADPKVIDALAQLHDTKARIKELEALEAGYEFTIKGFMKEAQILTLGGKKACSWKTQVANRVDIAALRLARPEIAQQFTVQTKSRVFRLS